MLLTKIKKFLLVLIAVLIVLTLYLSQNNQSDRYTSLEQSVDNEDSTEGLKLSSKEIKIVGTGLDSQKNKTNKPFDEVCVSEAKLLAEYDKLSEDYRKVRENFFDSLSKSSLSIAREKVLSSNYSEYEFRQYLSENPKDYHNLPPVDGELVVPSLLNMTKLHQLIISRDYSQLSSLYREEKLSPQTLASGKSVLSLILTVDSDISLQDIYSLLDAGYQVNFADFVYATINHTNMDIVRLMRDNYFGGISRTWVNGIRKDNLALVAISSLNYDAFDFWHSVGVPSEISDQEPNGFDVLPVANNSSNQNAVDRIFKQLVKQLDVPTDRHNLDILRKKLSPEIHIAFSEYFKDLSSEEDKESEIHKPYDSHHKDWNHVQKSISELEKKALRCGVFIEEYALSNDLKYPHNSNQLISDVEFLKSVFEQQDQTYSDEIVEERETVSSIIEGDWKAYLDNLKQKNGDYAVAHSAIAIVLMINKGASSDEIIEALNMGIPMDNNAIFAVINSDRIELVDTLTPYGLNLFALNIDGQNAYEYALSNKKDAMAEKLSSFF